MVDAEKRLFTSAVVLAKGSLSAKQEMPKVLAWLAPRCAQCVRDAAASERRARFVATRAPIWRYVWMWLHGYGAQNSVRSDADDLVRLRCDLTTGAEPERLRAAYELAAVPGGVEVLIDTLTHVGSSTSLRRTAMYGAIAARGLRASRVVGLVQSITEGGGDPVSISDATLDSDVDPILGVRIVEPSRWLSASVLRQHEGFDAECLLAAADPGAEVRFMAMLILARNPCLLNDKQELDCGQSKAAALLKLLAAPSHLRPPPSACLVALEALGMHSFSMAAVGPDADSLVPQAAALLAVTLASPAADSGTRAIAARALAQLAAQDAFVATMDVADAVAALHAACMGDTDRYVRGYAFEALVGMLHFSAARDALRSCSEDVASCLQMAASGRRLAREASHRWLCARRVCPLTSPESPF